MRPFAVLQCDNFWSQPRCTVQVIGGLHEIGRTRPRRLRPRPRTRPVDHLRSESLLQSTPLDSLYASLEKEVTRWHTCRSGVDRFYKQSLDSRLARASGPGLLR